MMKKLSTSLKKIILFSFNRRRFNDKRTMLSSRVIYLLLFSFPLLSWLPMASEDDVYFSIAVLPDTQYYVAEKNGGTLEMFQQQINWIRNNQSVEKIVYVAHVGDLTDNGTNTTQWTRARNMMYQLEASLPGLPNGIPYGVAVGNHDQSPGGRPKVTTLYNTYFGYSHFAGRSYYGGRFGTDNNNNHYDLFSAGGLDFIVIYAEYNNDKELFDAGYMTEVNNWIYDVLITYSSRKAIIISHYLITKGTPGRWSNQGKRLYDRIKGLNNVFLMLCGHVSDGEGYREDTYNCNTIKTYLSDYQGRIEEDGNPRGGFGRMRLMKFNITKQTLSVRTFAPRADGNHFIEDDENSEFTKPLFGTD